MIRLVILCVAWMVLSAVIAYLADGAGRKLGKKRLTLFGLRPKHTAILITTTTGALIALFSFGVLMLASSGIRNALARFDDIRAENEMLASQRQDLEDQAQILGGKIERLSGDVKTAEAQARQSRRAALEASEDLATVERGRREAVAARKDALAKLATQRVALTKLRSEYQEKQALLARAERRLVRAEAEYKTQLKRVAEIRVQVGRLQEKNRNLAYEMRQLDYEKRLAEAAMTSARADLGMARSDVAAAKTDLAAVKADLAQAKAETDRARASLDIATTRVTQMTAGKLVVASGDELARVVVPAGVTLAQARQSLKDALAEAGNYVLQQNREVTNKVFPVSKPLVAVTPRTISEVKGGDTREIEFTPAQVQESVAEALADPGAPSPNGVVVSIIATENTVAGDTAKVDFALYNNRMIFREGEEIAATSIDPRFSKETIMDDVVTALRDKVAAEARREGLMRSRDNALVSLRPEQLADLLNAIKGPADAPRQKPVTVRFMAAADTWTAGPLNLRLQVVP